MKLTAYDRTKKWRKDNPDKHRKQWESNYLRNKKVILERKRIKYKLNKMKNEDSETVL